MARQLVTRAQLRTSAQARLQNGPFWSDAELNRYINEALRTWQVLTGYWSKRVVLTTEAGNPYLRLPATMNLGTRVTLGTTPLIQDSVFSFDQLNPAWEGQPGTPERWAPVGAMMIALCPPDAVGTRQLAVDGVGSSPIPTADADYIDLGQDVFDAILDYIQHLCAFKEGGMEFASTERLLRNFYDCAADNCSQFRASSLYRRLIGRSADAQDGQKPRRADRATGDKVGVR